MQLIDGKLLAERIKDKIASEILSFGGPRPGLAIVLIGERPDSALYVGRKEKQAFAVGIDTHVYRCDNDIKQEKLIEMIEFLNNDDTINAILVQLPLPAGLDTDLIVNTIRPDKDVDGFTRVNLKKLMDGADDTAIIPPVYAVVLAMLESINVSLDGKEVALVANSDIFENNLAEVLRRQGADVKLISADDPDLAAYTSQADILITALGRPHFITNEMVKDEAVVIDIGTTMGDDGVLRGDVDFEDVEDKVSFISPVPGGVGPMTIAMAFWNTLEIFKKHQALLNKDVTE